MYIDARSFNYYHIWPFSPLLCHSTLIPPHCSFPPPTYCYLLLPSSPIVLTAVITVNTIILCGFCIADLSLLLAVALQYTLPPVGLSATDKVNPLLIVTFSRCFRFLDQEVSIPDLILLFYLGCECFLVIIFAFFSLFWMLFH